MRLQFDVLRIDLPAGDVRHSRKIWNHVDELRHDPALNALLAKNGIRAGIATSASWPALRAIFEALDARVAHVQHVVQSGTPLYINLGDIEDEEDIFVVGPGGRLTGKTFAQGSKCLEVAYEPDPTDPSRTHLEIIPEIRQQNVRLRTEVQEGVLVRRPVTDRRIYRDLRTWMEVGDGEFVVIGPGRRADIRELVGARWFTRTTAGARTETVLCISPQPFGTAVAGR